MQFDEQRALVLGGRRLSPAHGLGEQVRFIYAEEKFEPVVAALIELAGQARRLG